jgi:hypothetical protein
MITIQSRIHVARIGGTEIFNFLINPTDREYQRWWPGTHIELHNRAQNPNNIGNILYMYEFIGERRVKMTCIVIEAEPGKKIVWQMKKLVRLPIWLALELKDDKEGVEITHTIKAGLEGIGRILDFFFRLYFSDEFAKVMDEHVKIEFPKLRDLLADVNSKAN